MNQRIVVRKYKGKPDEVANMFMEDAIEMEGLNYFPINQTYQAGSWGCSSFLMALLLCFIFIGVVIFIYMLIVKPKGTLIVTYEFRETDLKRA